MKPVNTVRPFCLHCGKWKGAAARCADEACLGSLPRVRAWVIIAATLLVWWTFVVMIMAIVMLPAIHADPPHVYREPGFPWFVFG